MVQPVFTREAKKREWFISRLTSFRPYFICSGSIDAAFFHPYMCLLEQQEVSSGETMLLTLFNKVNNIVPSLVYI